jgi:hypothetical protein
MLGLLIVIALVAVPLLLLMRLSILMLARLFGVVSHSEVATRAEFARIREQLLLGGSSASGVSKLAAAPLATIPHAATLPATILAAAPPATLPLVATPSALIPPTALPAAAVPSLPAREEPAQPHWRTCPECGAHVASVAVTCVQCGRPQ